MSKDEAQLNLPKDGPGTADSGEVSEGGTASRPVKIAAVVLTFNRRELLWQVLESVMGQTRPVDEIIVVDNASTDGTPSMLREHFPQVTYLLMVENLGPAGGRAAGMKAAYERGHGWIWLCDDDILPERTSLERCLESALKLKESRVGIISPRCDYTGYASSGVGYWRARFVPASQSQTTCSYEVDLVTFSGALLSRDGVAAVGYPRPNYFNSWEDLEYCIRLRAAGYRIFVLPRVLMHHLADHGGRSLPPWRGYYQTRNHLAMALEHRSIREIFWWAVRQVKFVVATVLYLDSKAERIRLRALGSWHGLRGKMGRTIDPASYALNRAKPK
ncbi:MAG: glycosyltransferase [Dehalococcoidia bacterium]